MQESLPEFSVEPKVPTNPFSYPSCSSHSFTDSDRDNSKINTDMSEEISTHVPIKTSLTYNFLPNEVLIYSSIIPESSRRKDTGEKKKSETKQEEKEEKGESKKDEKEIAEEREEVKDETHGENVEGEKEKREEKKKDSSITKKSSKRGFFNNFFRKNKKSQEDEGGARLERKGHIEEKAIEKHIEDEEKHEEEKRLEGKHVEEKHANQMHVDEKHGEEKHDDEEGEGEDVEGKDVQGEHVEGEQVEGQHVEGEHVEGEHVEGEHVEGEHVEGEHVEEKHVKGEDVKGEDVEGEDVEGEDVEGEDVEGDDVEGEDVEKEEVEKDDVEEKLADEEEEQRIKKDRSEKHIYEKRGRAKKYSEDSYDSDEDSDESVERSVKISKRHTIRSDTEVEHIGERELSIFEEDKSHEEVDDNKMISAVLRLQDKREPDDLSFLPVPQAVRRDRLKLYFRRGFRPDNINLDGNVAFIPSHGAAPPDSKGLDEETNDDDSEMEKFQPVVYLSENEEPIDFLISLGFHIDEAALAIKEEEVKQRLRAALVEAKIWVKYLTVMEGTLILLLCQQITSLTMRFFLHMVEAIVNNRITSAYQIDAVFRALEKVDMGTIQQVHDSENIERFEDESKETDKKQILTRFFQLYGIANEEAECKLNLRIGPQATRLIEYLCVKYHPALRKHVDLIARYIGLGILRTRAQLDAAKLFCLRAANKEINIDDFELFCGFEEEHLQGPTFDDDWWESISSTTDRSNYTMGSRSYDTRPQTDTRESIQAMPLVFHSEIGPFARPIKSVGAIKSSMLSKHDGFHDMRPSTDPGYRSDGFDAGTSDFSVGEDSAFIKKRAEELAIYSDMKPGTSSQLTRFEFCLHSPTRASSKDLFDRMPDVGPNTSTAHMKSEKLSNVTKSNTTFEDNLFTAKQFLWSSESDWSLHSTGKRKYQDSKDEQKVRDDSSITYSENQRTGFEIPSSEIWSQEIPIIHDDDSRSNVFSHTLNPKTKSYTIISDGGTHTHVRDTVTQTSLEKMCTGTDTPVSRIIKNIHSDSASESEHSWVTMSDDASLSKYSEMSSHVPKIKGAGTPTSECTSFSGTIRSPTDSRTIKSVSRSPSTSWSFSSEYTRRGSEHVPPPGNSKSISDSFSNISIYRVSEDPRSDFPKSISEVRSGIKITKSPKSDGSSIEEISPINIRFHTSSSSAADHRSKKSYQKRKAGNKVKQSQSLSSDSGKDNMHQENIDKLTIHNELYVCDDDMSISNVTFQISGHDVNRETDPNKKLSRVPRTNKRQFDQRSTGRNYPKNYLRVPSVETDSRTTSISDFDLKPMERSAFVNDDRLYRGDLIEPRIITYSDFDFSTEDSNGSDNDARDDSGGLSVSNTVINSDYRQKTLKKTDEKNFLNQHVDTPMRNRTTIPSESDYSSNSRSKTIKLSPDELRDSTSSSSRNFGHYTEKRSNIYARQRKGDSTESETIISSEFDHLSRDKSYTINDVRQHSDNISDRTYSIEADSRTGVLMNSNIDQIQNTRVTTNRVRETTQLSSDSEYLSAHDMIERNK